MNALRVRRPNEIWGSGFSSFLNNFFNENEGGSSSDSFAPHTDVIESESSYLLKVMLPGLEKKDVSLEVNDKILTVSGERKKEDVETGTYLVKFESAYGSFKRSFILPEGINEEKIEGAMQNGVLEVTLPKVEKKVKNKLIKIN